jgi:hypothetical protein
VSESDNLPVWRGGAGAWEAWHLTFTDRASGDGYWIRFTVNAPEEGVPTGVVWFARFSRTDPGGTFGIHRPYDRYELSLSPDTFRVAIADSLIRSGETRGTLAGDGHEVRWHLKFPTGDPSYRLLPGLFYRSGLGPTPISPNVDTRFSGWITIDGERFEIREAPGQQGHVFGSRLGLRWAWAHCSDFLDEEAVLHALTAQGQRGLVTTPFLTFVGVRWQGSWIRLSKLSRRRDFGLGSWRVDLGSRRYRITGRIEAPPGDLLRARYDDPDGSARYCHNTEIASCRLALFERRAGGFDEVALLESRGTTHAEWAGRTPAAAVEKEHVEVAG